ncbi:TrkH family potassium uptake protein [Mangrovibrevibacter kandeliae]|uniref:TrkH family potassium uptake protein n=1 Tax=Mangrovibrevibacter kandeliae TaxID=2968473 RepID=UPI00211791E9|nr:MULTISPECIES: TrkH family potassium uptake protein [unclassified Aurantimonas]MCQ8784130.1 TrkH family potassium uptake protein [Aurantimonas sp. CSK15Z-1]MCW4116849.1 TrkH family potassium uptake protein [Aurantimonas sp. MSK8Z-1]
MLIPALIDAASANPDWSVFVGSSAITAAVCLLIAVGTRGERPKFTPRLGFLLVTGVWITAAGVGGLPLYLSSANITYAAAFFEAMSGLTTTGSTVLVGLDTMPRGLLMWRSMLQGIGGIGIVGMGLLILPSLKAGGLSLFQMESSDKSDKLLPRASQLAAGLSAAYVALTASCAVAYFLCGMTPFDAINHALATISTGGFSTRDASMGYFNSDRILVVSTVFMILGSMPFVVYVRAFLPRRFQRWSDPQIGLFLLICLTFSLAIAVSRRLTNDTPFGEALISSAFNLVSVISTTGFVSDDYSTWSTGAVGVFFVAMFLGGCAGSTTGGIKANRLVMLYLLVESNFRRLIRPHAVRRIRYGRQEVSVEVLQNVTIFFFLYFGTLLLGTMVLGMIGLDFVTAFTGTLTTLSNVGPGLGQVIGPSGNFATMPNSALWVLSAVMLMGRLELVTVVILLFPAVWRD